MVGFSAQLQVTFSSYREYLLYYRATHRNVWNNRLHFAGTALAAVWALVGLLQLNLRTILAGLGVGYTLAWGGDLLLEERKPASFDHPLWAARANMDLCFDIVQGKQTL